MAATVDYRGWAFAILAVVAIVGEHTSSTHATETIAGLTRVIDGDTIHLNNTRIRLHGIDAPEANQSCTRGDNISWPCGTASTKTLNELISWIT